MELRLPTLEYINSKRFLLLFGITALIVAALYVGYYRFIIQDPLLESTIRGLAFSGATLISLSLLSSIIFKWKPKLAKYWKIRRFLGVSGFIFGFIHAQLVIYGYYEGNLASIYWTFNPLQNPLIFSTIAYWIFLVMALTSIDWAVKKLGQKWKVIHRFVYLAFGALIFHFLLTNPEQVTTPPGILLSAIMFLTTVGQIFWFFRIAGAKQFKTKATFVGLGLMILFTIVALLAFN